ncbi:amino acid ABC transporter permease [Maridesulfovibrio salexigens]|uniref:Polar amino acid ABC transporter, inner membrane subunit n=1 Tax=Maridesulfovibrio salexigens (strain ATCC 14822 / DSM 2638 / NCIMB 8403 / VKM B-1763) TaxID=526222 RepID=C6BUF7_MARSD|nr:amino acid ABC transporter permease [Maridesulfovibrio salexigens]ACS79966.1 polar amino acid ABC transporter, inner membrane subunit [Maridesulfovibrio salexigens DSM 2638]
MFDSQNKISSRDILLLTCIMGGVLFTFWHLAQGLNYNWDWSVIPDYIARYDSNSGDWRAGMLTQGLLVTLRLSLWSILLALVAGTIMGMWRVSPRPLLRMISSSYVGLVRNIPPLVLIFIFYFFLGDQIMQATGITELSYSLDDSTSPILTTLFGPVEQLPAFLSGVLTMALFEGAYITEIVRAGIESIDQEQWEASAALGFNRRNQLVHIILPQAFSRSLPPLAGQFISTIKDSSIVSVISIQELTFAGQELMSATYRTFEIWSLVIIMYFILTFPCSIGVRKLEIKMNSHNGTHH